MQLSRAVPVVVPGGHTVQHGEVQWRGVVTIAVGGVEDDGRLAEQKAHQGGVTAVSGSVQRRVARVGRPVDVGAGRRLQGHKRPSAGHATAELNHISIPSGHREKESSRFSSVILCIILSHI